MISIKLLKQLYWNHTSVWVFSFSCIFSEHLLLRTPLGGYFWIIEVFLWYYSVFFIRRRPNLFCTHQSCWGLDRKVNAALIRKLWSKWCAASASAVTFQEHWFAITQDIIEVDKEFEEQIKEQKLLPIVRVDGPYGSPNEVHAFNFLFCKKVPYGLLCKNS